jgi:hypothetical protein
LEHSPQKETKGEDPRKRPEGKIRRGPGEKGPGEEDPGEEDPERRNPEPREKKVTGILIVAEGALTHQKAYFLLGVASLKMSPRNT